MDDDTMGTMSILEAKRIVDELTLAMKIHEGATCRVVSALRTVVALRAAYQKGYAAATQHALERQREVS